MSGRESSREHSRERVVCSVSAVGDAIKNRLRKKRLSQRWLAGVLGISEKHLSQIVQGHCGITFPLCYKLGQNLGGSMKFWAKLECERYEK